jgi:hypothetical protein
MHFCSRRQKPNPGERGPILSIPWVGIIGALIRFVGTFIILGGLKISALLIDRLTFFRMGWDGQKH